jgi:hypothetical protein
MPNFDPITLQIIDGSGKTLFNASVPFRIEMDVQDVMEDAFIIEQTVAQHDPLPFVLEYYGYSENDQFPGYLGYEVESIFGVRNDSKNYWQLLINDVASMVGSDSAHPKPGATVTWKFTSIPTSLEQLAPRAKQIHERRLARATVKSK